MTKTRIRQIRETSRSNSAHQAIIAELLEVVESFNRRARRGEDLSAPAEELPLAAKVNPAKKARGTKEEILAYVKEQGLTENDGLWFWEKMMENDWKVGKQPVKCYKGRIRTWKLGSFFPSQKQNNGHSANPGASTGPARCIL